eukprot:5018304-Prymnesium_polylepis.1
MHALSSYVSSCIVATHTAAVSRSPGVHAACGSVEPIAGAHIPLAALHRLRLFDGQELARGQGRVRDDGRRDLCRRRRTARSLAAVRFLTAAVAATPTGGHLRAARQEAMLLRLVAVLAL